MSGLSCSSNYAPEVTSTYPAEWAYGIHCMYKSYVESYCEKYMGTVLSGFQYYYSDTSYITYDLEITGCDIYEDEDGWYSATLSTTVVNSVKY